MSLQKRIWQSRIRGLPTDQDVSPAEAESPPVPQPVVEEEVVAEEKPTEIQNLPENNKAGIGNADSNNAYVTGGVASLGGSSAPVLPGPKPGGKTPSGKITAQRWDGEKGKFTQEIMVPWGVKVLVDDMSTSVSGYTNLMPSMSKDADNQTIGIGDELFRVAAPYMAKSMLNLIDRVGKKEALEIIAGEIPNPPWQTGEMHIPGPVPGLEPPEGNEPLLRPDGRPYGKPASPGPKPGEPGGPEGPPEPDQFPPPVDPDGKPYWWYDLPWGPEVILPPWRPDMHEPKPGPMPDGGWPDGHGGETPPKPTKYPPNEWPYGPYPDGQGGWRWLWPGWSPTDPVPGGPNIVSDPYASL
ncbi:MAG: hypothetical protein HOJ16_08710 [Candidatus Peribacter sp.]|nr:hypothetical protein [Candidatus Peribacter sp.]